MVGPNNVLWQCIRDFEFDEVGARLTFAARLARENGWRLTYARRVVEEYKRFVFLAMVAGHEVTPSEEVDQAWHLHLVYTRSYWDELCGKVLGRPLHHNPTQGGQVEGERFDENYRRTLATYCDWFGDEPPADIWPSAEIRFGESAQLVRVNTARLWVVNKRAARNATAVGGLMCLSLAGLGAARPLAAAGGGQWIDVIVAALVILAAAVLIACLIRWSGRGSSGGCGCGTGGFWGCGGSGCGSGRDGGGSGCGGSGCGGGGCGGGCGGGGN